MALRGRLIWGIPVALVLLVAVVVIAPFLLIRTGWFRDWAIARSGLPELLSGTQRIRVERVTRLALAGLHFDGIEIETRTPRGWTPWLRIGELDMSWNPGAVLARKFHFSSVAIDSLRLDLTRMPRPLFASRAAPAESTRASGAGGGLPSIRCSSLRVNRVLVLGDGGRRYDGNLELAGVQHEKGDVRARLGLAVFHERPDSFDLTLRGGRIAGMLGRSIEVDSLSLRAPWIEAGLHALWMFPADSGSALSGTLALTRLHPYRLPLLRRMRLPWASRDSLEGRIRFDGRLGGGAPPRGSAAIDLAGLLFGQGLDTLLVRAAGSPEGADLRELRMRVGDFSVRGTGGWVRPGKSASARLRFDGLDLSGSPVQLVKAGLPSTRLGGEINAEADSIGPRVRVRAQVRMDPGRILQHDVSGFSAGVALDPDQLRLEDLETSEETPSVRASGSLRRADKYLEATGSLDRFSLEPWIAPWLDRPLTGEVSGPFRLQGRLPALQVSGDLGVRGGRIEEVYVDTLHLSRVSGRFHPLDLRGDLTASGLNVYKIALDSIRGPVRLADTISSRITAWRDTTRIRLITRVLPRAFGSVLIDSIVIQPGSAPRVDLAFPARIDFNPREVRCDTVLVRSSAGSAGGAGWIQPRPGAAGTEPFAFRVHGEAIDLPSILDYFHLPPGEVTGKGDAWLEGTGTLLQPRYRYHAAVEGAETFGWQWERLSLSGHAGAVEGDSLLGVVAVDSLRGRSTGYVRPLPGPERTGPEPPAPPIRLEGDSLSVTCNRSWAAVTRAWGDSLWSLLGRAKLGGSLRVSDLPLTPILARILQARTRRGPQASFAPPVDPMVTAIREVKPEEEKARNAAPSGVAGTAGFTLRAGGTGANPRATADLEAQGVRVYQATADSVRLRASFADSLLDLAGLDWYLGRTDSHAGGTVPLRLALRPGGIKLLPRPMHLTADLPDIDLSLASLFTSLVQDPGGRLSGRVSLVGVAPHIHPEGTLTVSDGSFRVPAREERFTDIESKLQLDSLGVHILSAEGKLNNQGRVRASGFYRDDRHFDLKGSVRQGLVFETGNYRFIADADLAARPVAEGDSIRPHLTGTVRVQEGLITQDLSKPPAGNVLPPQTPWLVDLDIDAPSNLRANQPAMTVDLGEGALHASFRWPYWNLSGTLTVLDGRYRIFNREFRITSGTVEFQDIGTGPNPVLDVQAETTLPPGPEEENGPVDITVEVKGSPAVNRELQVSLSSPNYPEYSEAELIQRMSVGQINSQVGSFSSADPTRQFLSTELMSAVERQLVSQLPLADRIQLTGEVGGQQPLWINLRPIVRPQWSVDYAQELSASPGREVSVRYRLSNLFFLNSIFDRRPLENGVQSDTYSLDLKLRFEY